jgi:hypothetical protein
VLHLCRNIKQSYDGVSETMVLLALHMHAAGSGNMDTHSHVDNMLSAIAGFTVCLCLFINIHICAVHNGNNSGEIPPTTLHLIPIRSTHITHANGVLFIYLFN